MNTEFPKSLIDPAFGIRIKDARVTKKMSIKELSDRSKIPVSELVRIEDGKESVDSAKKVLSLSEVLGISKEELIVLATKRTYNELSHKIGKVSLIKVTAAALGMREEELWMRVADELIYHEIYGEWRGEDVTEEV